VARSDRHETSPTPAVASAVLLVFLGIDFFEVRIDDRCVVAHVGRWAGGVITRRWIRPSYATFPDYIRRPVSIGVITLGTVFASWATLAREPLSGSASVS